MKMLLSLIKSILTIPLTLSMIEKIETEIGEYDFNYKDNVFDIQTGKKL